MGRPRKNVAIDNRRLIVERATVLFAEFGFDAVPIRLIAESAGVHVSTLYHYFPEKAELYDVVVTEAVTHVTMLFVAALDGTSATAAFSGLQIFFEKILTLWGSDSPYPKIIDRALLQSDTLQALMPPTALDTMRQAVHKVVQTLTNQPVSEVSTADIAEIVFGVCYGIAKLRRMNQIMVRGGGRLSSPKDLGAFLIAWLGSGLESALALQTQGFKAATGVSLTRKRSGSRATRQGRLSPLEQSETE